MPFVYSIRTGANARSKLPCNTILDVAPGDNIPPRPLSELICRTVPSGQLESDKGSAVLRGSGWKARVVQPGQCTYLQDLDESTLRYVQENYLYFGELAALLGGTPFVAAAPNMDEAWNPTKKLTILFTLSKFWVLTPRHNIWDPEPLPMGLVVASLSAAGPVWSVVSTPDTKGYIFQCTLGDTVTRGKKRPPSTPIEFCVEAPGDVVLKVGDVQVLKRPPKNSLLGRLVSKLSLSVLKSAMQKIIRAAPRNISLPDGQMVHSEVLLESIVQEGCSRAGHFNPNVGKYIRGAAAMLKRLIVTVFEDAACPVGYLDTAHRVMVAAFLCDRVRTYQVPQRIITEAINLASATMRHLAWNQYKFPKKFRRASTASCYPISSETTSVRNISTLLTLMGSMQGDKHLLHALGASSDYYANAFLKVSEDQRSSALPMVHFFDQHTHPPIAYAIDLPIPATTQKPLQWILRRMWEKCSSWNVRRNTAPINIQDETVRAIRAAQEHVMVGVLQGCDSVELPTVSPCVIRRALDPRCLTGMLPVIRKGALMAVVTLRDDGRCEIRVTRKPARGSRQLPTVPLKDTRRMVQYAMDALSKGLVLCSSIQEINGLTVYADDDGVLFVRRTKRDDPVRWATMCEQFSFRVPYHPASSKDANPLIDAYRVRGDGIREGGWGKVLHECSSVALCQRVLFYLAGYPVTITMLPIGRGGEGLEQTLVREDPQVYLWLLRVCTEIPGALRLKSVAKFESPCPALLWELRDRLRMHLNNLRAKRTDKSSGIGAGAGAGAATGSRAIWSYSRTHSSEKVVQLGGYGDGRVPTQTQQHAVQQLSTVGGSMLVMPTGTGKTFVSILWLRKLQLASQPFTTVMYFLPASSVASILGEFQQAGAAPIALVDTTKCQTIKIPTTCRRVHEPLEGYINLVPHDMARRARKALERMAPVSVCVFDEGHKMLNHTQRTSVALSVSKLCLSFLVMTATPMVDSKVMKLVRWLELFVPFTVTPRNVWSAVTMLHNFPVSTGVKVLRKEVIAPYTADELNQTSLCLPVSMGGTNRFATNADIRKALDIDRAASTREMVRLCLEFREDGVLLVAQDTKHQQVLADLLERDGVARTRILVLGAGTSINFTRRDECPYDVVIARAKCPLGFTCTAFGTMIRGVYAGNQADRTQMDGRLNRLSQVRETVMYFVVHCGVLSLIHANHNTAANMESAIKQICTRVHDEQCA